MINGMRTDWESITVTMPHGPMFDFTSIKYDDGKDGKAIYGKGSMPRGEGRGNYSANFEATMQREEWDRFLDFLKASGSPSVYGHPLFPVTVSYRLPGQKIRTDTLNQVRITKFDTGADQGAEKVDVTLKGLVLGGIDHDGLPADVNL